MIGIKHGKIKVPIEIQHCNNSVTFCFVHIDKLEDLYSHVVSVKEFLPVYLLSTDIVFIAKSDIRAFRVLDTNQSSQMHYIWSGDPYTILGVHQDITLEELHEKYIGLLKQIHPEIIEEKNIHSAFKDIASDLTRRVIGAYEFIKAEIEQKG